MPEAPHSWHIEPAVLQWQDRTPVAVAFDDVYFSKQNGLQESEYVFLEHNRLASRWSALPAGGQFTIVETGFGTGLNFLAACRLWLQQGPANGWLHVVSFEKYPLTRQSLIQACEHWPELATWSRALVRDYPSLTPGFHRVEWPEWGITLTLCFGDVNGLLPLLEARADAWFLDGFAPGKNPDMWREALFQSMPRLSRPGATFATFTAVGRIRRQLQAHGFHVHKAPGFGPKRDMLHGEWAAPPAAPSHLPAHHKPWFATPSPTSAPTPLAQCLVIGGGLAGTASAWSLAQRGWRVTLLERHHGLAQEASGNATGVLFTKLSPHNTPQNRFYQLGFLHALQHVRRLLGPPSRHSQDWSNCGVLQLAYSDKETQRQQAILECGLWPCDIAYPVDNADCRALTGCDDLSGLFFPKAGWVNPPALCRARCDHPNIRVITGVEVDTLRYDDGWHATDRIGNTWSAPVAVLATAAEANRFNLTRHLPLNPIRGQVTHVPANYTSRALQCVLSYDGYTSPARQDTHCVGATFHPKDTGTDIRPTDHRTNLNALARAVPGFRDWLEQYTDDSLNGRASLRCQTPDYLPIVGPAPKVEDYQEAYDGLRHGKLKWDYPLAPYWPDLYLNLAHGSRGLSTAALGAEMVTSYIMGEPQPVDRDVLEATHPGRFLIRELKRRQR